MLLLNYYYYYFYYYYYCSPYTPLSSPHPIVPSRKSLAATFADYSYRKCDVLNRGFNGYTSAFNKLILPRVLQSDNSPQGSIAAAVVLLGSNDSVLEGLDNRSLTLQQYTENMCDILKQLLGSGLRPTRIVLVSPPAVCEDKWRKHVEKMGEFCWIC